MGSRKNWPKDLADRCNAVGWPAELVASGHWKAKLPDGTTMSWAESPSDGNAYKNAMRVARSKGLDRLEQDLALQREKERLERIERDRERNGVPESAYQTQPEPNESETDDVTLRDANPSLGWIEVNGIRIAIADEHRPVMHQHNRGGAPRPMQDARELMLVDGTIRYQCRKETGAFRDGEAEICERHFEKTGGLASHWARGHQGQKVEERPAPEATTTPQPEPELVPVQEPGLVARMVQLTDRMNHFSLALDDLTVVAKGLHEEMQVLAGELPQEIASDEMRQKAEILDQMRGLLK